MASINFTYGTIIPSTWLNDVDAAVYEALPMLSAQVAANLISPTFVSPSLGMATATTINKVTITTPATTATLTIPDGAVATVSGTNTGDQTLFSTVKVAGQSDVVADTTSDSLTLVGGTGISITTDPDTDSVTFSSLSASLTLLATLIPTTAASINFLNTFTSEYDSYFVVGEGIQITSSAPVDSDLWLRLAVGGSAVATSVYYPEGSGVSDTKHRLGNSGPGVPNGITFTLAIHNTNGVGDKLTTISSSGGTSSSIGNSARFTNSGVLTGFQLTWAAGYNFHPVGAVRVYGYRKA